MLLPTEFFMHYLCDNALWWPSARSKKLGILPFPLKIPVVNVHSNRLQTFFACAFLIAATLAVYWPARHYDFVAYDDNDYVYENKMVLSGLTWQGVEWSFVDRQANNWHPLTWLSHMTDCQVFGLNAGGPHMVNVALHCANAVLLFLLLQTLMRRSVEVSSRQKDFFWRNLFIAGLFALHPLRVESVAWISERKDVLSGFFGLLSLLCYARYASGSGRPELSLSYRLAVIFFAGGLLSKPMLVTLPLVMLLLDYWPLRRWPAPLKSPGADTGNISALQRLLTEKWPFFLLSLIFCVITLMAQQPGLPGQNAGLSTRLESIPVNYFGYLEKLVWPQNLSFLYLRPDTIPIGQFFLSALALLLISALAFTFYRRCPALAVGWLWFLIVLLPVCGIVSLGRLSIADRYTYLPAIGFYLMLTWALTDLAGQKLPAWSKQILLGSGAAFLLAVCAVLSRQQLASWQNTQTLYEHALKVDPNNDVAKQNLHIYLFEKANPSVRTPPPQ
jgi:protein O-mannosyl-transferase